MIKYKPHYADSWALVIGINGYQFASPLSYACNDAYAVASVLREMGFDSQNLFLLKDGQATKQAIMDRYLELSSLATEPDDRVVVFFAGHGFTTTGLRGEVGYLVPVDGDKDKPNSLIRWDDLTRNADLIPAKHILFIVDACLQSYLVRSWLFGRHSSAFQLGWHARHNLIGVFNGSRRGRYKVAPAFFLHRRIEFARKSLPLQCPSANLQIECSLTLHDLTEENSFTIIKEIAQQLVLAYNHQTSPRCFNYKTEVFPWNQYFSNIHDLGG